MFRIRPRQYLVYLFWGVWGGSRLSLLVATLGTDTVLLQANAAQRAAVNLVVGLKIGGCRIDPAGEGDLGDIQFVLLTIELYWGKILFVV